MTFPPLGRWTLLSKLGPLMTALRGLIIPAFAILVMIAVARAPPARPLSPRGSTTSIIPPIGSWVLLLPYRGVLGVLSILQHFRG